jgi:hypothetical protein
MFKIEKHNNSMTKIGTAKVTNGNSVWYIEKQQWEKIGIIMGWKKRR